VERYLLKEKCGLTEPEDGMLRNLFESMRKEIIGECKRLYEDHHNMCSSPNTVTTIKPRRMRWLSQVAQMGDSKNLYKATAGKSRGNKYLQTLHRWEAVY
jgi:hypothetical protein